MFLARKKLNLTGVTSIALFIKSSTLMNNNLNAYIFFRFVQDNVKKDFFNKKPKRLLYRLIRLLEHVVIVFDLYTDEKKLGDMYDFLHCVVKPNGLSDSLKLVNILDQWRLRLFRLHVNRQNVSF